MKSLLKLSRISVFKGFIAFWKPAQRLFHVQKKCLLYTVGFCLFLNLKTAAQGNINLTFTNDQLTVDNRLQLSTYLRITQSAAYTSAFSFDAAYIAGLKKDFYEKFSQNLVQTLKNLNDPATGLASFYKAIWPADYPLILAELAELQKYSMDYQHYHLPPGFIFHFLISPADLDGQLDVVLAHNFALTEKIDRKFHQLQFDYSRPDLLKAWLLTYYNDIAPANRLTTLTPHDFHNELIALAADARGLELISHLSAVTCCDNSDLNLVSQTIRNDVLIKSVLQDAFYKQLIWVNQGYFKTNPFISDTVPDLKKADLYNQKLAAQLNAACCSTDPVKLKKLINIQQTGRDTFTTIKPISFGIKNLADLQNAKLIVNRVKIPFAETDWKTKHTLNYTFDNFETPKIYRHFAFPENESFALAIHNIPTNYDFLVTQKNTTITDQSKVAASLAQVGTLGDAFTGILAAGINFAPVTPLAVPTPAIAAEVTPAFKASVSGSGVSAFADIQMEFTTAKTVKHVQVKTYQIKINGISLTVSSDEAQKPFDVLNRYLSQVLPDSIFKKARRIEHFYLDSCGKSTNLDFSTEKSTQISLTNFINAFKAYGLANKDRSELFQEAKLDYNIIKYILQLNDLQVPKANYELKTTAALKYRSEDYLFDETNPPIQVSYTVTQEPKGTKNDTVVLTNNYKVGKRYWILASAGIGVTYKPYTANTGTFTNNQLAVNSDYSAVRVVAGLHFYPLGLYQLDDSFMGFTSHKALSRLSLFTGLGFPSPLKNYYIGISDDIFPGVRFIVGPQLIAQTRTEIDNNQLYDSASAIKIVRIYTALTIDPVTFVKMLAIFK